MSLLQTILVCDNYEIGGSPNYHFRIFSRTKADLFVVTITVSASDQKITDITEFSLRAVYIPKVKCVATNLQSLSVLWGFSHLSRATTSSCLHLIMALCRLGVKTSLRGSSGISVTRKRWFFSALANYL
ncbi:MAG: hypothetical protein V7K68_32260 [Nostoc sp.]|uniref:hypothetical protein n=1 Tax=Nostoc sp. TaxID=1180 RepID=UPI002FFB3D0C